MLANWTRLYSRGWYSCRSALSWLRDGHMLFLLWVLNVSFCSPLNARVCFCFYYRVPLVIVLLWCFSSLRFLHQLQVFPNKRRLWDERRATGTNFIVQVSDSSPLSLRRNSAAWARLSGRGRTGRKASEMPQKESISICTLCKLKENSIYSCDWWSKYQACLDLKLIGCANVDVLWNMALWQARYLVEKCGIPRFGLSMKLEVRSFDKE